MDFKDYYKILGVDPEADAKTIKTAYRKLARKYHPDVNPDAGAEDKFKEVAEAYQVLKDSELRAEFDDLRKYGRRSDGGFQPPPGWQAAHSSGSQAGGFEGGFSDFFNSVFGDHGQGFQQSQQYYQPASRGQDVEIELPIFLEETLTPTEKTVAYTLPPSITGQGGIKKQLKVKVPQGVMEGERIRLVGQGQLGSQGAGAGDLYLHIRLVPHPLFDVSGHNILLTLPLAPWEAVLGTKITVPTLTGKISLTVPANTPAGKKFRIKGKGLKSKSITGDFLAIVKIVMPAATSEQGKQLWQQLADQEAFNPRGEWGDKS